MLNRQRPLGNYEKQTERSHNLRDITPGSQIRRNCTIRAKLTVFVLVVTGIYVIYGL